MPPDPEPASATVPEPADPPPAVAPAPAPRARPDLDEIADPRPFVFRELRVGLAIYPSRQTSILRRAGNKASLRIIFEKGVSREPRETGRPERWKRERTETFVGTVHRDGKRTRLDLASAAGKSLTLWCRSHRLAVHRAGAELVRTPRVPGQHYSECSEQGVWRPSATRTIDALACAEDEAHLDPNFPDRTTYGPLVFEFAPLPGVELLSVNDDCLLQGTGHRVKS